MAASEKCPRCYCEGNRVGCGPCFYSGFNCPGNCLCCEENRESSAQIQAKTGNSNGQRNSTQKQGNRNIQKEPIKKQKRTPFRPLILRNVKKALVESQKKAAAQCAAQCKEDNSTVSENTNKVNLPSDQTAKLPKDNSIVSENTNKVNLPSDQTPKLSKVDAETKTQAQTETPKHEVANIVNPGIQTQVKTETPKHEDTNIVDPGTQTQEETETPQHEGTNVVDPGTKTQAQTETPQHEDENLVNPGTKTQVQTETPEDEDENLGLRLLVKSYYEFVRMDNEAKMRLYHKLFWPRYVTIPCKPYDPNKVDEHKRNRVTTADISKEHFEEGINDLIGNLCLNCHCKNPRDSCDICKQTDYQCLGTCLCCSHFRSRQRYMIFMTSGLHRLPNGAYYGGGNITMSCSA